MAIAVSSSCGYPDCDFIDNLDAATSPVEQCDDDDEDGDIDSEDSDCEPCTAVEED